VSAVSDNARHNTPHKLHMALVLGHEEFAWEGRASNLYCNIAVEKPPVQVSKEPSCTMMMLVQTPKELSCTIMMLVQSPKEAFLHE